MIQLNYQVYTIARWYLDRKKWIVKEMGWYEDKYGTLRWKVIATYAKYPKFKDAASIAILYAKFVGGKCFANLNRGKEVSEYHKFCLGHNPSV